MDIRFSNMSDDDIYKAYISENSNLIKMYLLKGDEATYHKQSALLLEKYKGTIVEDDNDFVVAYMDYLNDKCEYGDNLDALTEHEKTVFYVDTMNSEVHSKGFKEYLKSEDFPGYELY